MATTRVGDDDRDDCSGVRVDGPRPAPSFSSPSPSPPPFSPPPFFSPSPLFSPASSSSLLQWPPAGAVAADGGGGHRGGRVGGGGGHQGGRRGRWRPGGGGGRRRGTPRQRWGPRGEAARGCRPARGRHMGRRGGQRCAEAWAVAEAWAGDVWRRRLRESEMRERERESARWPGAGEGIRRLCRVPDRRHSAKSIFFAECRDLTLSEVLKKFSSSLLSASWAALLCRVPTLGTRQNNFFLVFATNLF